MTRKKWNKLRRQRPELFTKFVKSSWESLRNEAVVIGNLKRYSRSEVVAKLTAFVLSYEPPAFQRTGFGQDIINQQAKFDEAILPDEGW